MGRSIDILKYGSISTDHKQEYQYWGLVKQGSNDGAVLSEYDFDIHLLENYEEVNYNDNELNYYYYLGPQHLNELAQIIKSDWEGVYVNTMIFEDQCGGGGTVVVLQIQCNEGCIDTIKATLHNTEGNNSCIYLFEFEENKLCKVIKTMDEFSADFVRKAQTLPMTVWSAL